MGLIKVNLEKAINVSAIISVNQEYTSKKGLEKSVLRVHSDEEPNTYYQKRETEHLEAKSYKFEIPFDVMLRLVNYAAARHETIDLSTPEKIQEAREKFSDEILHKNKVHLPGLGSSFNAKP